MKRRSFITLTGAYAVGGGMILFPQQSQAILPWIARFLFMGLRRTAIRSGISSATQRSAFKSILEMSIVSGSILSVSPNLFADINKYNAQAIWINEGVENNFQLFLSNSSDSIKAGQLSYQLRDIDSGQVEIDKPVGYISSSPKDKFVFSFSISDLPYLGAKKLIAKSSSEDLLSDPSGAIIVSTQSEVHFDDKA